MRRACGGGCCVSRASARRCALIVGIAWMAVESAVIAGADSVAMTLQALPVVALRTQFGQWLLVRGVAAAGGAAPAQAVACGECRRRGPGGDGSRAPADAWPCRRARRQPRHHSDRIGDPASAGRRRVAWQPAAAVHHDRHAAPQRRGNGLPQLHAGRSVRGAGAGGNRHGAGDGIHGWRAGTVRHRLWPRRAGEARAVRCAADAGRHQSPGAHRSAGRNRAGCRAAPHARLRRDRGGAGHACRAHGRLSRVACAWHA